jgi:hypothetical protein
MKSIFRFRKVFLNVEKLTHFKLKQKHSNDKRVEIGREK